MMQEQVKSREGDGGEREGGAISLKSLKLILLEEKIKVGEKFPSDLFSLHDSLWTPNYNLLSTNSPFLYNFF